jgi:hypothetical protein
LKQKKSEQSKKKNADGKRRQGDCGRRNGPKLRLRSESGRRRSANGRLLRKHVVRRNKKQRSAWLVNDSAHAVAAMPDSEGSFSASIRLSKPVT